MKSIYMFSLLLVSAGAAGAQGLDSWNLANPATVSAGPPIPNREVADPLKQPLTDSQVAEAVKRGFSEKITQIGLTLNDLQTAIFSGLACDTCQQSGYTITVFTPDEWIEYQAATARREMAPYSPADVTAELRQPVLRVIAYPSRASYINGQGLSMSSSVHRVVLCDKNKETIIQPLTSTNGSVTDNSAFRSMSYATASATFSMADVARIRGGENGEFFVVVVGDNQNKYFKIKTRYLKQLFR